MFIVKELGKYKCMELSSAIRGVGHDYFDFSIQWSRKRSHAGFEFLFQIWNWIFEFNITDRRHWDYDNDCFEELLEDTEEKDELDELEENIGIGA